MKNDQEFVRLNRWGGKKKTPWKKQDATGTCMAGTWG